MSAIDREPFPRGALIAAGSLVAFSLLATAVGRLERLNAPPPSAPAPRSTPAASIDLRFADDANGAVIVREASSGRTIATLAPGTNGFVRGVMRGLVRDRKMRGIGAGPPFQLTRWDDRRLTLKDTATGRTIDLDAFGSSNKEDFVVLLPAKGRPA